MTRRLSTLLCLLAVMAMVWTMPLFAGGSGEATTASAAQPVEISIFGVDVRAAQGYNLKDNLWVWQELGKRLNMKFQFDTTNNYSDLIVTKLNSGQKLEDLFCIAYKDPTQFIDAGLFVQLDDLIAKDGPNITKVLKEAPNYRQYNTSLKDGKLYTLSGTTYRAALQDVLVYTARKDWLDKLNLKAPTTVDELYNDLVAIRDGDPNGNGIKDEIPLVVDDYGGLRGFVGASFGLHLMKNGGIWVDKNGKVYNEVTTDAYEHLLMFLNKLYMQKLIPGDIQSMTWETAAAYFKRDLVGFSWTGWWNLSNLLKDAQAIDPKADVLTLYPPSSSDGKGVVEMPFTEDAKRYAVTKYSEHPEAVIKLIDYLYSDEGWMLYMYGIAGQDYNMVNGDPVPAGAFASAQNINAEYEKRGMRIQCIPMIYAPISQSLVKALPASIGNPVANIREVTTPGLYLNKLPKTAEEVKIINNEDLNTYIKETEMAFVLGNKPFSQWDEYQAKLVDLGINDITAVYQKVYDRNYK